MRVLALLLVAAFAAPSAAAQQHDHDHAPPGAEIPDHVLGSVEFPISCAAEVQPDFERAVAMLHSFWFEEADAAFTRVIEADPACPMGYWGRAMTAWGNPMTRAAPPAARAEYGRQAAARARELSAAAPERERLWVEAAAALFDEAAGAGHLDRMRAHEAALRRLMEAHPDDVEAAIFYGRIVVGNAPPDDLTFSRQLHAAEVMEPLFQERPDHPGLAHYLIHAYDAPAIAEEGLDAAMRYADIAPDAPHALHMPTHIFTRLGFWEESIELNARSAQAEPNPDAAVHPMDYQVYAYLQLGRDRDALEVVERARQIPDHFYGGLLGYNFAAMHARFALERNRWEDAAELTVPEGALPYVEAIPRFARALGAARLGDPSGAAAELEALARLRDRLEADGDEYWATVVGAQYLAASAWAAHARGESERALELAQRGAELEGTVEKHPVTPGPLLPARELLGDLLMELGRPDEALQAYEATLVQERRRARALFGAARAAEKAERLETAKAHYRELLALLESADPDRPELEAARRVVEGS